MTHFFLIIVLASTAGGGAYVAIDEAKDILGKNGLSTILVDIFAHTRSAGTPRCRCCCTDSVIPLVLIRTIRWRNLTDCQIDPILDFCDSRVYARETIGATAAPGNDTDLYVASRAIPSFN